MPQYVALYGLAERKVLDLVPGITDPASIEYSNESSQLARAADPERFYVERLMPEKIRLNLTYAAQATPLSDVAVIAKTMLKLIRKSQN